MDTHFSLLETILFTPDQGFYLIQEHLNRLQHAIDDFRQLDASLFPNAPSSQYILDQLEQKVSYNQGYQRVRLLIDTSSSVTVESTSLPTCSVFYHSLDQAAKANPSFSIILDIQPFDVSTDDPFILHKTTHRVVYEQARARTQCSYHPVDQEPFDVVLYNKQNQITETSIANLAIGYPSTNGYVYKTPPISCGLLSGVFRSFLIKQGLQEQVMTVDDLIQAQEHSFYRKDSPSFALIQ
ncbi:aminotransferase [Gilbertella persicaria]|uniref:aminotransferase n=1 Tax=Gilbertella persicaria TaxID=101096 RepID=UPI0022209991|nr:aminotransferase [Gilbertella persicaria]KAI8072252.1 aminotransferase [Gilbertella persicaria]